MESNQVRPIDSFLLVYKVLALTGFYKHLAKPKSYIKYICHQIYRSAPVLMVAFYNLSNFMYIYQTGHHDIDTILEVMTIELPILNILAKYLALNLGSTRLDKINEALMNDPMLLPKNKKEEEFLTKDKQTIISMLKRICGIVFVCLSLWTISCIFKRIQDPEAQLKAYMPFETESWFGYSLAVFLYTFATNPWAAYGHIAMDCAIAAYYLQAQTQLKIIRQNLERLAHSDNDNLNNEHVNEGSSFQYRDIIDPNIKDRFVYNVKKFEKVVWYTEEVDKVLNKAIGFSFLSVSFSTCVTVNIMSSAGIPLLQLAFFTLTILIVQTQLFLYCHFGDLVTQESSLLTTSIYKSDWCSLSPGFRRGMLIAMARWSRPLVPKVNTFVVIPLSLNTFIVIVRSTYSLFTMLKAAKN